MPDKPLRLDGPLGPLTEVESHIVAALGAARTEIKLLIARMEALEEAIKRLPRK